jgi:hypothetical protein
MPFDRMKARTVLIPIKTYRSVKHTSAEIDRTMSELLAEAWSNYFEKNMQANYKQKEVPVNMPNQ